MIVTSVKAWFRRVWETWMCYRDKHDWGEWKEIKDSFAGMPSGKYVPTLQRRCRRCMAYEQVP